MGYRRALLTRWSTRDTLAVLVIALTVAFITGTGLVMDATASQTTGMAAEWESEGAATLYEAPANAPAPTAAAGLDIYRVTSSAGQDVTIVQPPPDGSETSVHPALDSALETAEVGGSEQTLRVQTESGEPVEVSVRQAGGAALFPADWYVATAAVSDQLESAGILVVSDDGTVPLAGVLPFFLAGSQQLLWLFGLIAVGGSVLLATTVFGVTRMTVQDRSRTIRIVRATGAGPRQVLGLFAVRAGLLTVIGLAAGYALGVVLTNATVNTMVSLGQASSIAATVSPRLAGILLGLYVGIVVTGILSGVVAAYPTVRAPPAQGVHPGTPATVGGARERATWGLGLLNWRAVVPITSTLVVFLVLAIVAASTYGVLVPLVDGGSGQTVVEPESAHVFASSVPAAYVTELRSASVAASPEILALGVRNSQPYLVRGVNYSAYERVADARLQTGRAPAGPDEALIGSGLQQTLDVAVGEWLLVGGSTRPAVTRVQVVGTYSAPGPADDQLLVSLQTGRHLANRDPGTVHLIRTDSPVPGESEGHVVTDVEVPGLVEPGGTLTAHVSVRNVDDQDRERTIHAAFGEQHRNRSVTLAAGEQRTIRLAFDAGPARTETLTVGPRTTTVTVGSADDLQFGGLPETAPPNSAVQPRVVTRAGDAVANATVTIDQVTFQTGPTGRVALPFGSPGEYTVTATKGERTTTATVRVAEGVHRAVTAQVAVEPRRPIATTAPTARVNVTNPWNVSLSQTLTIDHPTGTETRAVQVPARESETLQVQLPRVPPGNYDVTVRSQEAALATASYRVRGDERLASALASGGQRSATTGLGQTLDVVLGNVELVLGTLIGLAGVAAIGSTAATFAGAVYARRRTIGIRRATGAGPLGILRLVLRDALVIASVATGFAIVIGVGTVFLLADTGLLTAYGVRLVERLSLPVVLATGGTALGISVLGATLATLGVLRTAPATLLQDGS